MQECVIAKVDTTELYTNEVRKEFEIRIHEIQLRAERELQEALQECKRMEKDLYAFEKAAAVARGMAEYQKHGLSEEKAWELVKQEASMMPFIGRSCCT